MNFKEAINYYGSVPRNLDYPDISMYEMIENIKNKYENSIAYEFMGKSVTYKDFVKEVNNCAMALLAIGVKEGDTVTVCLPNVPQAVVMFYAINRIGAIASMVHPLSAENEIMFYLNEVNSEYAITLSQFFSKFEAIQGKTKLKKLIVTTIAEALPKVKGTLYKLAGKEPAIPEFSWVLPWKNFISGAEKYKGSISHKGNGETPAVILFSGGTTGTAKGILLTNLNFNALALQTKAASEGAGAGDTILSVMPVFHGFGLGVGIHTFLSIGGRCVLIPRLNVGEFPKLFKKYRPNYMAGVPTLFEAMMRNEKMKKADLSCLKGLFSGGDSLSVELKKKIDAFLKEGGAKIQVREGYGTTECVTASCLTPAKYYREGSIGLPYPDTYYKIVITNTLEEANVREMGEICLTGPTLMKGYINNPKETAQTLKMHEDGKIYLHTGDLGYMDEDGFVYFIQRLKRMIVTNGYNVYPSQVENVIDSHEAVMFSTVIGVSDERRRQRVKAFVVLKPGFSPSEEIENSLRAHCEKSIAKYALPKEYEFRDNLPKTLVGKVAYRELEKEEEEKTKKR